MLATKILFPFRYSVNVVTDVFISLPVRTLLEKNTSMQYKIYRN